MLEELLHIMYIYDDLCSVYHYVMMIFLNSVESELIYMEIKGVTGEGFAIHTKFQFCSSHGFTAKVSFLSFSSNQDKHFLDF